MGRLNTSLLAFNRGVISPLALARVDLDRLRLSAETQTNWVPRVLGSMTFRPGTEYLGSTRSNATAIGIPFIFSKDETAIIEMTSQKMRVWVDDELVTRPSVSTAVTNGTFATDLSGWTDDDEDALTTFSFYSSGQLHQTGNGVDSAILYQEVTVGSSDQNVEHALRVVVDEGPVVFAVGTSAGDTTYISAVLNKGTHSLTFTPTGNFFIQFSSPLEYTTKIDSVTVESSGVLELDTVWEASDLASLRYAQSADIIFLACYGKAPYQIERRSQTAWSIVEYQTSSGPYGNINVSPITLRASATTGDIALLSSKGYFTSDHVGMLFKLISNGQYVTASIDAENEFTNSILVTGAASVRGFAVVIEGTGAFTATITLQRSVDETSWTDVGTYTADSAETFNDQLENIELYYRIGVKTGDYTSGTIAVSLSFGLGNISGIARVTSINSSTSANADVLKTMGNIEATDNWYASQWSPNQGYPSAVSFHEGRLWFAGKGKIWGSVSDQFNNFDNDVEGDSGTINRNIGYRSVDDINWLMSLRSLFLGSSSAELDARSNSFEEPLTPTNFNIKAASNKGSSGANSVIEDERGIYVQAGRTKAYQLQYDLEKSGYLSQDISLLSPEILQPGVVRVAIQGQPDSRVHFVRSDGKVAILVKDEAENVLAWILYETDGEVEDVVILPGDIEDNVYYFVKRTINGSTVRYLEKWAKESEARGGATNKVADSFLYYSGASTSTITGLDHLEGETVVAWGNGEPLGSFTVSSGSITLSSAVTTCCVGLGYSGDYKSAKLAYASDLGTALGQTKKVHQIGLIARDIHREGITIGSNFTTMYELPKVSGFQVVDPMMEEIDEPTFPFGGHWDTDSRVCIRGQAPYPATLLALVLSIETNDKA